MPGGHFLWTEPKEAKFASVPLDRPAQRPLRLVSFPRPIRSENRFKSPLRSVKRFLPPDGGIPSLRPTTESTDTAALLIPEFRYCFRRRNRYAVARIR